MLLGGAVLGILAVLVAPLPSVLLDFLITTNISVALLILFVAMYVRRPLEFSVFPSLLLVTTLFRLSLNVAATRLILLHGGEGAGAAGHVIQGFGQFVVGGNFVVGVVVFLILVVIQFVVITKGAGRIAEVAARFTLDAMPGKQMAIDADLNAGLVGEQEARSRREQIAQEADFYGAMDGASKFVRGDAVAALIITGINIVGGLAVGVLQEGMPITDALATYTILTVGDGLVAQLPALITSTAAGIVVTRAASESDLGQALGAQLGMRTRPLGLVAALLGVLAVFPGLPVLPFAVPALVLGTLAYRSRKSVATVAATADKPAAAPATPESVEALLPVDPLQLEVGYGLLALVDTRGGSAELPDRIRVLRRQFAQELGLVIPPVRIRDNVALGGNRYAIKLRGADIAQGEVYPDRRLAMSTGQGDDDIDGIEVREPTFGLPARWIVPTTKDAAEAAGYTVVEPGAVVATHLSEMIRRHAPSLLGRQEVQSLLNQVKESHPAIVDGVIPALLPLGVLHRVLQRLLAEGVSIRDLPVILEVLADVATATKDAAILTEHVRAALAETVCRPYVSADGILRVLILGPTMEARLTEGLGTVDGEETLSPALAHPLLDAISRAVGSAPPFETRPVLLCQSALRRHVRRFTERRMPHLAVLSFAELPPNVDVRTVATVEQNLAAQAV